MALFRSPELAILKQMNFCQACARWNGYDQPQGLIVMGWAQQAAMWLCSPLQPDGRTGKARGLSVFCRLHSKKNG